MELGIEGDDYGRLFEALGVDFRGVSPRYTGPLLYPKIEGCQVDAIYGFYTRWVENESGGYNDFCHFPLQNADEETIRAFPFPSPDDFDYEMALDYIRSQKEYALYIGSPGTGDIINSIGRVMGMEDTLVNLMTEDEATLDLARRKLGMEIGILERLLDKAGDALDFMWLGEDLGTQIAPMISVDMYRRVLRPMHQQFIDLAKAYHLPVMVHTCGSSSWVYEDFIEMGVNAVDTLQPGSSQYVPCLSEGTFRRPALLPRLYLHRGSAGLRHTGRRGPQRHRNIGDHDARRWLSSGAHPPVAGQQSSGKCHCHVPDCPR